MDASDQAVLTSEKGKDQGTDPDKTGWNYIGNNI